MSALVAGERRRVSGQDLTEAEARLHADLLSKARGRELDVWEQLKVSSPVGMGAQAEEVMGARWALTWEEEAEGKKTARPRPVAKGGISTLLAA